MLCSDCRTTSKIYHDKYNPCTKGESFNGLECEAWKKNFPKEYKKYQERILKKNM